MIPKNPKYGVLYKYMEKREFFKPIRELRRNVFIYLRKQIRQKGEGFGACYL
jgi:hypothetical protein